MAPVLLPPELLGVAAAGAGAAGEAGGEGLGEVPCPERFTPFVPTPAPWPRDKFNKSRACAQGMDQDPRSAWATSHPWHHLNASMSCHRQVLEIQADADINFPEKWTW